MKNDLISTYSNLDEEDAKVIAEWLEKNKKDISGLKEDDLQEIFGEDTAKIKVVAAKLSLNLDNSDPESDPKPDDEKQKEIQKWVTKLKSLEDADFNALDQSLKEKVAQKFIISEIDINEVTAIKEKLAGFINGVKEEKKQNEISIKIEKGGNVTITNVADKKTTDFNFNNIGEFEKFVGYLKDKEITNKEVELSFAFVKKNVKIGDHESGFDVTVCFGKFLNCFEDLIKIENFKVSNLTLGVSSGGVSLNSVVCDDDFYKGGGFWTLVKDHAALFGITEKNKFEIVKEGSSGAVVKIEGFKTELVWSEVVVSENTFKKNSGWNNIFKFKNEEKPVKTDVTVEFKEGKCFCGEINGYGDGVVLNDLAALEKLVGVLDGKNVKIGNSKNFSLAFDNKTVKVCGHETGFEVMGGDGFATLLKHVAALKELKAIDNKFKIQIAADDNDIKLGGEKISQEFIKTANFWNAVKAHKDDLFSDLGSNKIVVSKVSNTKHVKIGNTELVFDVLANVDGALVTDWNGIFNLT